MNVCMMIHCLPLKLAHSKEGVGRNIPYTLSFLMLHYVPLFTHSSFTLDTPEANIAHHQISNISLLHEIFQEKIQRHLSVAIFCL